MVDCINADQLKGKCRHNNYK